MLQRVLGCSEIDRIPINQQHELAEVEEDRRARLVYAGNDSIALYDYEFREYLHERDGARGIGPGVGQTEECGVGELVMCVLSQGEWNYCERSFGQKVCL